MRYIPAHTRKASLVVALLTSVAPFAVLANPVDGHVSAGSASIANSGSTTTITQSTDKAVIDWRGFDVGASETTRFVQPATSSLTVNRVGSGGASQIDGNVTANGNIVIINPNGIVFGAGAHVDANSLVATTANISNANAMAGNLTFDQAGNPTATIENRGSITAKDAGLVGLVAPNVINSGVITAKLGRVHLASGDTATVDLYGDGLIEVKASDALQHQLVENTGTITAHGGTIALTAAAGRETVDSLVHVSGTLDARGIGSRNGEIYIYAEGSNAVDGNVTANKGTKTGHGTVIVENALLNVSGRNVGEHGGKVTITGDNVGLLAGTIIDASGYSGISNANVNGKISDARIGAAGGDIQIGGDYLGQGITPTALNLYVDPGVLVVNDALMSGDAGRTIFWSDGSTQFFGNVYARALGGQPVDPVTWNATPAAILPGRTRDEGMGGFVETSGHGHLDAGGYVDLTASSGNRGTYFLDPTDITIYGNVDPTFVSTDGTLNLASSLKLWLDASDTTKVNLTYKSLGTTAIGTSGTNTLTVSANTGLTVGARIRIGGAGSVTAASTVGADTYTISAISGTTITLSSNLTTSYAASGIYQGYVSQETDKSGLGNNATQVSAGSMPLWISNGQNGLGVANFNGTNNGLSVNLDFLAGVSNTVFLDAYTTNFTNIYGAVNGGNGSNSLHVGFANSGSYRENYWGNDFQPLVSAAFNSASSNILTFQWVNGGNKSVYANNNLEGTAGGAGNIGVMSGGGTIGGNVAGLGYWGGNLQDIFMYTTALSTNGISLLNQYQSAKWGIALTPPGSGATEAAQATASIQKGDAVDGFSVFTTRYLERLSQSANVSLQASNNINLDLKGDTLNFTTAGRSLTLTAGNQITTGSAGTITTNNGAISLTGANGITINNNFALNSNGGAININSPTAIASGATLTVNGGTSDNTIATAISGAGGLTQAGTGILTLSGTNTYTGATAVNAGTLNLGAANALSGATAVTVNNGATLAVASGINATMGTGSSLLFNTGSTLSGTGNGSLAITGPGSNKAVTMSGNVAINGGTGFTLNATGRNTNSNAIYLTSGAALTTNGAVTLNANGTGIAGSNWALYAQGASTINAASGTLAINAVGAAADLASVWSGPATFGGNVTYTASSSFNNGDFYGFDTNGLILLSNANLTLNGNGTLTNSLLLGGSTWTLGTGSTVNVNSARPISLNGNWTVTGGTVNLAAPVDLGVTAAIINTGAVNISGIIGGASGLTKSGVGTLTLTGANTYTGTTTINAGTLQIGNGGTTGTLGSGAVTDNAALKFNRSDAVNISNLISGTGSLTQAGNGITTLLATNSYSGGTTISAGTLQIDNGGATGNIGSGAVVNNAALIANRSDAYSVVNAISGTGTVTITGGGSATLLGVNTYTGATTINAGSLILGVANALSSLANITVNNNGTLGVASGIAATLANSSSITLNNGSSLSGTGNASLTYLGASGLKAASMNGNVTINGGTGFTFKPSGRDYNSSALVLAAGTNLTTTGTLALNPTGTGGSGVNHAFQTNGAVTINAASGVLTWNVTPTSGDDGAQWVGTPTLGGTQIFNISTQYGPSAFAADSNPSITLLSGADVTINATGNGSATYIIPTGGTTLTLGAGSILTVKDTGTATLPSQANGVWNILGTGTLNLQTPLALTATTTINNDATVNVSGATTGAFNLTKSGTGTLTLAGANTYTGTTTVNAGTLNLSGGLNVGAGTATTVVATGATLTSNGVITAATLTDSGGGTVSLTGNNMLGNVATTGTIGNLTLANAQSILLGNITASSVLVQTIGAASDIVIDAGKTVVASGAGNALTLVAGRNFINNSGSGALSAAGGRWLVYSADPANNTRGGLMPDASDFNHTYAGNAPATLGAGNRFEYARVTAPTITLATNNDSVTYGNTYTASNVSTSYTSGLVGGDAYGSIGLTGAAGLSTTYVQGTTGAYATPYSGMITATTGTLASKLGYTFAFTSGDLTVNKRILGTTLIGSVGKTYDGDATATLTGTNYSLSNVYGSDAVGISTTSGTYDDKNVNTGKTVNVSGLNLSGAKAANYTLASTTASGAVGTITKKALTITADNKHSTYGDTITAGSVSYNGFITGESSSNLLTGPTVASTQSGIINAGSYLGNYVASGATAANYSISYVAGDLTVDQRVIGASLIGSVNKTYDGNDSATLTGTNYSLSNVYGSDAVGISTTAGTYDDKNATTGKTVTVSGLTLNGAKAANYTLSSTITSGSVGSIDKKSVTVTADDKTSIYGNAITPGTASYNGFITGEGTGNLTTAATVNSTHNGIVDVGGYADNYTASGAAATNYSFTYVAGNLAVTPRALLVTTNSKTKLLGTPDPVFTGSNTLIAQDAGLINWNYGPVSYTGTIGNYTIDATAADPSNRLANYTRSNAYGTFVVNAASSTNIPDSVQLLSQDPAAITISSTSNGYTNNALQPETIFGQQDGHYVLTYNRSDGGNNPGYLNFLHYIQIAPSLQQQLGLHVQPI